MHKSTIFVKGAKVQSLTIYTLVIKYRYILNSCIRILHSLKKHSKCSYVCDIHNFNVIQVGI